MSTTESEATTEASAVAKEAGLVYVDANGHGIRRRRCGRGFTYVDALGETVRDPEKRERIDELVIPPAWEEVWICPDPIGHIQATGRDTEGRKQYIYHPAWREAQDRRKFLRMYPFGLGLPSVRRTVGRHLRLEGIPLNKVAAAAVRVLDVAAIRVGNDQYAVANQSFGLTTLRGKHLKAGRSDLTLEFAAKGGKEAQVTIADATLVRVIKALDDVAGYRIFQYVDETGSKRDLTSTDVNAYLHEVSRSDASAKDFRTWAGNTRAVHALAKGTYPRSAEQRAAKIKDAMEEVADLLGNTPSVARSAYVDPRIVTAYADGDFPDLKRAAAAVAERFREPGRRKRERLVMAFLECLD